MTKSTVSRPAGVGSFTRLALAVTGLIAAGSALAQVAPVDGAVITYGNTSLGVNRTGELNFFGSGPGGDLLYGVYRNGVGDAIAPGCPCEGWGVALTDVDSIRHATWANQSAGSGGFGAANTFAYTGSRATSEVSMGLLPVTVRQTYAPSLVADVFQVQVKITNNGSSALSNLVYRRAMDWDVPPTEFYEYVSHVGVERSLTANGGNVLYAGNNGFATSDPREYAGWDNSILPTHGGGVVDTTNRDFAKAGPSDHGSVFDFSFGQLAAGDSRVFNIYYGSAANEAGAVAKATALGVDLYSLGQSSNDPVLSPTFLFAFGGVGGAEPGSSQDAPVLPQLDPEHANEFSFDAPVPRRWYDPPFATGYEISVEGGFLISVTAPTGFSGMKLEIGGVVFDSDFLPGETFLFSGSVDKFKITGLMIDLAGKDPGTVFPLYLDFDASVTSMTWKADILAVPEPATYGMLLSGLAVLGWAARRRKQGQQGSA